MQIILSQALQNRIFEQMRATYPDEGGGFLFGTQQADAVHVQQIAQVQNVFEQAERYHRYAMTPQDWARLEDEAEAQGLELVGYYHSHPNAPAIPSVFDRDHALPNFTYLITQVQDGQPIEMRAWRLTPDRTAFDAEALVLTEE